MTSKFWSCSLAIVIFIFKIFEVYSEKNNDVTIFASMGKFDPADKPQVVAIRSWQKFGKDVILFVDEGSQCSELLTHFAGLLCVQHYCMHDELKIPFVSCLLISAEAIAKTKFLMYTNADIIFSSLTESVDILNRELPHFSDGKIIGMGQRTDLDLNMDAPFPEDIMAVAKQRGVLHPDYGIDYFLYTKGSLPLAKMPPFLIGNSKWDNWLLSELLIRNASSVIDMTRTFLAVHVGLTEKSLSERKGYIYNEQLWKISRFGTRYIGLGRVDYSHFFTEGTSLLHKKANVYEGLIHSVNLQLHRSGFVYILSLQSEQIPLFNNWLIWARKINFSKFLVYAMDDVAAAYAKKLGILTYIAAECHAIYQKHVERGGLIKFPDLSVDEHFIVRNNFFILLVKSGFSVISIEVDTILLADPVIEISSGEFFVHSDGPKSKQLSSSFFGVSSKQSGVGEMFLRRITKCMQQRSAKGSKKAVAAGGLLSVCLNEIHLEFKMNQQDIFKMLPLSLIADSRSFFEYHVPQSFGFLPAIIHVDNPPELSQKTELLHSWNLLLASDTSNQHHLNFSTFEVDTPVKDLVLTIRIFVMQQPELVEKLLNLLSSVDYESTKVHVEFFINKPADTAAMEQHQQVVTLVKAFKWKHGSLTITEETANAAAFDVVVRPLKLHSPGDPSLVECVLLLEEGVEVSPYFFSWAKAILLKYADQQSTGLYGLSLQRQHRILGLRKGEKHQTTDYLDNRIDPKASFYRYQLMAKHGQCFYANYWNAFVKWAKVANQKDSKYSPCVPYLLSNKQYLEHPHSAWTVWFNRFIYDHGLFNLYINYNKYNSSSDFSLTLHRRDLKTKKGTVPMRLIQTQLTLKLSPMKYYPLFDFFFGKATESSVQEAWRFTSNYNTNSCVTNV